MKSTDSAHVLDFFTKTHQQFPGEAGGVAWSARSQQRRFEVLLEGLPRRVPTETILDAACGYGDLIPHLTWQPPYQGIDLNPHLLAVAQQRYPQQRFSALNLVEVQEPADWVISSGAFNLVFPDNYALLEESLRALWRVSRKGLLFNLLITGTHGVQNSEVFFYDLDRVLRLCRELTPALVCRTDYLPHDATFYLYREKRWD